MPSYVAAFHVDLREACFIESQNARIEYRWARVRYEQLPALATNIVQRQVGVILATGGPPAALAAKAATSTIPILFAAGGDALRLGLVASLGRLDSKLTGIMLLAEDLEVKRIELLSEMVPSAKTIAVLINPNLVSAERQTKAVREATQVTGQQVVILHTHGKRLRPRPGNKPSDLPVLQPIQFDIVINARAAKALGITIPPSLLPKSMSSPSRRPERPS